MLILLRLLAAGVDLLHAAAMVLWAIGLPLLFWRRYSRASRVYIWYALAFVIVTRLSHSLLGECVLTTLARKLRRAAGDPAALSRASFSARLVEQIAGFRPTERSVVIAWEIGVFVTAAGLVSYALRARARTRALRSSSGGKLA